ncbi:MAG: hypothetical protein LQ343_006897 [Gyalolechia ehrenbergii]|nr:MAG: hypothetical protein LQ343_006897 [Gyalolechia ehrenbergii]
MRSSLLSADVAFGRRTWHFRRSLPVRRRYLLTSAQELEQPAGGVGQEEPSSNEASPKNSKGKKGLVFEHEALKESPSSLQLPLSPLMDPTLQGARNRYRVRKPEPSGEPSDFQKRLSKNPYAQALATPVRSCSVTNVRLPSYFLLDFGLTPHPRTGKPWQIPIFALDPNVSVPNEASRSVQVSEQSSDASSEDDAATDSAAPSTKRPARAVAGSHVVSQRAAMKFMSDVKRKSYLQMVPHRWKLDTRFKTDDLVWREDMDVFVLDLMRKKAVRLLKYLSSRSAAYIAKCEGYEDIQNKHQPGAVLWWGKFASEGMLTASEEPPPPYAMVKYRSAYHIPVYNLPAILGSEYLRQLRVSTGLTDETLAVIKQKRNTVDILTHLWKLMGYLASNDGAQQLEKAASAYEITRRIKMEPEASSTSMPGKGRLMILKGDNTCKTTGASAVLTNYE